MQHFIKLEMNAIPASCALEGERAARLEAERRNTAKDELLAVVCHELRNPLAAVLGWVRLLRSGELG